MCGPVPAHGLLPTAGNQLSPTTRHARPPPHTPPAATDVPQNDSENCCEKLGSAARSAHLAPDDAVHAALLLGLGLVDEGNLLAEVELGLILGVHAADFDQGGVSVLVGLAPAMEPGSQAVHTSAC